jgi:hypothetical protein
MKLGQAKKIAEEYNLTLYRYSWMNHYNLSFYNSNPAKISIKLFKKLTMGEFRGFCISSQPFGKSIEAAPYLKNILKNIKRTGIAILGLTYYPDFNSFTITADGFAQARFVFSLDFKKVCCAFLGTWKDNHKLAYLCNSVQIPYIFPVEELEQHVSKINI